MLTIKHLSVTIHDQPILQDMSFSIDTDVLSIIGPSGAGKSTLLHCLAGIQAYTGTITLNGLNLSTIPIQQRNIGFVTQQSTLLPHLTVFENIALPLQFRKLAKPAITQRVNDLLDRFGMTILAKRLPQNISGGELRRVMLARALIYQPDILLLDEPFAGVDRITQVELVQWLKQILQHNRLLTLYVTHDITEARYVSEQVLVLEGGQQLAYNSWSELTQTTNRTIQNLLQAHF